MTHARADDPNASGEDRDSFEDLMTRYQQADAAAATALVETLSPRLLRFFAAQSPADAPDLLQETWLRIHRARHTYRPELPFLTWAFAIAYRVRVDAFRRHLRASREIAVRALPELEASATAERDDQFDSLIERLPESQREVLTMLKVDGLSIEEVAAATRSTSGAVKQKAHRAYARLRKVLTEAIVCK